MSLEAQFRKADIPVRIVEKARQVNRRLSGTNDRAGSRMFLMDIRRSRGREEFVVRPGEDADAQVLNVDPGKRQMILYVHEKARSVASRFWNPETGRMETRHDKVPEVRRHYLLGMDECHLFATELPRPVSTVRDAHRILKPRTLEKDHPRQGEFFFVKVTDRQELARIEKHVKAYGVLKKSALGHRRNRGRPHIADERVVMKRLLPIPAKERVALLTGFREAKEKGRSFIITGIPGIERTWVRHESEIPTLTSEVEAEYVRGGVRHPDHRTRKFHTWHRVVPNTETREARNTLRGMTWID